ncbi:MAPEG family protein [Thiohalorhabdus methylotrophus]|uniref:MAPEG family protein n=1 Tax=Thiohalorhabdus methylotrophus TaxID=3242694 RepID=A0ABV4TYR5_9GAMM
MQVVALYGALLALGFVALSIRTLSLRRRLRIPVGDGENPLLARAIRAHANFSEYVPLALLLLYFVESVGASGWLMHGLGLMLVVGRSVHAVGVSRVSEDYRFRVFGMALTFTTLIVCSLYLLWGFAVEAL